MVMAAGLVNNKNIICTLLRQDTFEGIRILKMALLYKIKFLCMAMPFFAKNSPPLKSNSF